MTIHPAVPLSPTGGTAPTDALLTDGSVVSVRAVTAGDLLGLQKLNRTASDRSRWLRYFSSGDRPGERYAEHLVDPHSDHLAVVAERGGQIIGVASAEPLPATGDAGPGLRRAEVALLVGDRWQHTGVGTLLLEHLSATARSIGITRFEALVLTQNAAMFDVFVHAGFDVTLSPSVDGQVEVSVDLRGGRPLAAALAERERRSTAASIAPLLSPRSVVVVGAGRRPGNVGHAILGNIRLRRFTGQLAVVNQRVVPGEQICGTPAYRSVDDVPWQPDLALIAVPAAAVPRVLEDCGRAGVRGAVVITAGFAESGDRAGQADLVAIAHRHGIRLIGPNCLGVLNTDPAIRLDATFGQTMPRAGEHGAVGLASQSGALGIAVLAAATESGLGVSGFVSLGNKADVSGNDLMLYCAGDPRTQVIALYLESIGNPRRFRRIAGSIARTKPIVALRSGRSAAGARAGTSHTAAAATADAVTRALFRDAGVIAVETTAELTDVSSLLANQPVPRGRRVVIISNGGGPGALAADAADAAGAEVVELSADTLAQLRVAVGGAPSLQNPIDLGATAAPLAYEAVLDVLLNGTETDAVVVLHTVTAAQPAHAVVRAVEQIEQQARSDQDRPPITVAGALIGAPAPRGGQLPWFGAAESAARAVGRAGDLAEWRAQAPTPLLGPAEIAIPADIDQVAVAGLLRSAPRSEDGWLSATAATRLLELIGVPVCRTRQVSGVDAAVAAARDLGGAVVVKTAAPGLRHKSEHGGVVLEVSGDQEVAAAARRVSASADSDDLIVQPYRPGGLELLVGLAAPAEAMPVVMVAAGGIHEAVHADRVLRTLPLAPGAAGTMLTELRCAPLLAGHRGSPALDRTAVAEVLSRIALLDSLAPQIRELDVNPLVVGEHGVSALDVRVRVAGPEEPARRRDPVNDDYERALG
jgi:acyl-CoA synthetase (NDP forming)/GNAT superfamily N-acetyltransferase